MNKHHRARKKPSPTEPRFAAGEGIRHRVRLKVDSAGRILVPAGVRAAMGIAEGSAVLAWLDGGELRLVAAKSAAVQARRLARELIPGGDSLADELIAERREEARRERKNG